MMEGSPNLLIVGPGRGLGSSHNAIWCNLVILFYIQAENRPSKRRLDRSLAKSLGGGEAVRVIYGFYYLLTSAPDNVFTQK